MNKTARAPARSRRKGQPIAEGEPRAREVAAPTTPAPTPADAPAETPPATTAEAAPSPEDTPTLKSVRAIRPRSSRKVEAATTSAENTESAVEEPGALASARPRPPADERRGEDVPDDATLAEEPSQSSQPSQPSQSTTKLHTLAIMAEVARRTSAGNASDPHAPATPDAEAGIAPSAFLPPIPESLKERLRAPLSQASMPEETDSGSDSDASLDASQDTAQDSGGMTLSRLAIRADAARLALRESLRRQHRASQPGSQSGSHSGEDLASAADQGSATQMTRPTNQRSLTAEGASADAHGHHPLPTVDLLPLLTTLHAGIGATAALVAVVLLLARSPLVALVLALAGLAGGSSMLASLLARSSTGPSTTGSALRASTRPYGAGIVLLGSQFAMLAWALVLLGPRAALLFLVPAMALWALRVLGRGALSVVLVGALLLYSFAAVLLLSGLLVPAVALGSSVAIVLDGALAALGLALTFGGVEGLLRATLRARARARARELDVAYLRARLGTLERESALDVETTRTTLRRAIRLRRATPLAGTGPLAGLYPTLNTAMERVATLSRDREERLRLEGALRRLIQAVEKSWLGLPWSWPEESGTLLDELVALLRTPSLERQPIPPAGDESTERAALPWPLVPIPSAEVERERLRAEAAPPHTETRHALREFTPPPGGASSARWTPWA